jgi:cyclopropane-fatty-acyl-phospholipid synthase
MWEFYLAGSEISFRHQILNVIQIQVTKHQDTLPITRDYIFEEEARLRQFDKKSRKFKSVKSSN